MRLPMKFVERTVAVAVLAGVLPGSGLAQSINKPKALGERKVTDVTSFNSENSTVSKPASPWKLIVSLTVAPFAVVPVKRSDISASQL